MRAAHTSQSDEEKQSDSNAPAPLQKVNAAPHVSVKFKQPDFLKQEQRMMLYNMPAETTLAPMRAEHPFRHNAVDREAQERHGGIGGANAHAGREFCRAVPHPQLWPRAGCVGGVD